MKSASNESQIETMLENLPPALSSRLEKRLSSAPWTPRGVRRQLALTIAYLMVALLIVFIGLTPQGRAFAQMIYKFFTTTDQASFPLSQEELDFFYTPAPTHALSLIEVTPMITQSGYCSNPEDIGTYICEIKRVEEELNIDLKEFSTTPLTSFDDIASYAATSSGTKQTIVQISYQAPGSYLVLTQGIGDFPPDADWEKVPASAIQAVQIGIYEGEYVNGAFGLKNGDTELTWSVTGADQRLRWREGERWFEILEAAGPGMPGYLDKQALISLASNMVYQPESPGGTIEIDFDFIPNVALAEKICECDILQAGKLPDESTHFDHAKYDPERKSITLSYGYHALRILQTPLESAPMKDLGGYRNMEMVHVGDTVGQYAVSSTEKSIWESVTPPAFPTNNTYSVLLWEKDGMVYQIYFDQSFSGGTRLTKEQMIEIAESLH